MFFSLVMMMIDGNLRRTKRMKMKMKGDLFVEFPANG